MPEPQTLPRPAGPCAPLRRRRLALMVAALLVLGASAAFPAQTISELSITGLPPGITADELAAALAEKSGTACSKELEAADCAVLVDALKDLGYLEAGVKAATSFAPGGVRLVFTVTPRSLVTIATAQVPGLAMPEVQQLLDGLQITKETPCTHVVCQRLSAAVAERMGINALFVGLDFRISASKHDAVLVFSK
jgi:hypothetical protein